MAREVSLAELVGRPHVSLTLSSLQLPLASAVTAQTWRCARLPMPSLQSPQNLLSWRSALCNLSLVHCPLVTADLKAQTCLFSYCG